MQALATSSFRSPFEKGGWQTQSVTRTPPALGLYYPKSYCKRRISGLTEGYPPSGSLPLWLWWQCMVWKRKQCTRKISQFNNHRWIRSFFKIFFFSLILERGGGREKERERNINVREKHQSTASCMYPNLQGMNLQPRHVPCLGIKPATLRSAWWHSTN